MKQLQQLAEGQRVCLIGSVPPKNLDLDRYDLVVRCNDHWVIDAGRCDILFHICSSPKIKMSWLLNELFEKAEPKLYCLFSPGAEFKKMKMILECQRVPFETYDTDTEFLKPLREHFKLYGGSPSTGLTAAYAISKCGPAELLITGCDLYAHEPDHIGWTKHLPLQHCDWYEKLLIENSFIQLGSDLVNGIKVWRDREKALNEQNR